MSAATCPSCGANDQDKIFCPSCGRQTVTKVRIFAPSTSAAMEYFWKTGDPSVFANPGARDYDPTPISSRTGPTRA